MNNFKSTLQRTEFALASLLLVVIVILIGIASIARGVGSPIIWSIEIAQLLFVWLCMLAADLALQQNRHFGLVFIQDRLSPHTRRRLEIANTIILIALVGFLLAYAWDNMFLMHPRLTGSIQMNGSLIHGSMVFGLVLLLRTMIAQLIQRLRGKAGDA